jgi:hypothetical protein
MKLYYNFYSIVIIFEKTKKNFEKNIRHCLLLSEVKSHLWMFSVTILWSVRYGPIVMATISLMHLMITFQYGYSSVHEPSTPIRYSHQHPYTVTVQPVNTYFYV